MDATYGPKTTTATRAPDLSIGAFNTIVGRLGAFVSERRRIGRIARELAAYTDRDLADMGLTRGDIPAVARGNHPRG